MTTNGREYRLRIDAYTRETMPMKALAEYLTDMATLFGEEGCVHLIGVESSSTCPVVLVDWEAEPKVVERLLDIVYNMIRKGTCCCSCASSA